MQRDKGRRGELEVLARLNAIGGDGELLYGQPELGGKDGDVDTLHGRFEVKRRAAFPTWLDLEENVRGVYMRRDRGPWLVVLRANDAEVLMAVAREHFSPSDYAMRVAADRGGTYPAE
jgi:hypothetical protein